MELKGDPARVGRSQNNPALQHLLKVEGDINAAASGLRGERYNFSTTFPAGAFGNNVRAAAFCAGRRGAVRGGLYGRPPI